jgi:polyisoprenoid-binding protein YceI
MSKLIGGTLVAKSKWIVDTPHSSIDFSVKHMMIATVKGSFHNFDASIEADPSEHPIYGGGGEHRHSEQ